MTIDSPFYICARCGLRTFIPAEVEHRFCFRCHLFEGESAAQVGPGNGCGFAPVETVAAIDSAHGRQLRLSLTDAGMRYAN